MTIAEVFSNPTVKTVAFEAKFPNLFFLESKIGDLQIKLMERFPEALLLFRQNIVFADIPPGGKLPDSLQAKTEEATGQKVWQFRSPQSGVVNVQTNSIVIQSDYHKTYNNPTSPERFRDSIKFVMDSFLGITNIPLLLRIGLRYVDECPIPEKSNQSFSNYYSSVFPLERFNLADATEMDFKTVVKRGDASVRFVESLQRSDEDKFKLVLDFDGFQERVNSDQYLIVTDQLHDLISAEFEASIKEPVYTFMRQPKEG
jgi:uncharacterized protein (TIGR04255 family)